MSWQRVFAWKLTGLVWLVFGLLEGLIGLRVLFKWIGANPANPFAVLVNRLSSTIVWPFLGLTRSPIANGGVVEVSSIIAMFVIALIAWAIVQLIWILVDRPSSRPTVVRETRAMDQSITGQTQKQSRP
jgi:uncharacterized protein YggT (Ycf19 family)